MSEKYRLIKHNENLAEICNNESVGLLFLVDEDCERKLEIIVDLLNKQQDIITELKSIINFASNEGDLIVLLMKEIIKLRQEVQECQAYETIEKGVSL